MELWPAEALVVLALTKGLCISSMCAEVPVIGFSGCKRRTQKPGLKWFLISVCLSFHCDVFSQVFWKAFWRIQFDFAFLYRGALSNLPFVLLGIKLGHLTCPQYFRSPICSTRAKTNLQYLGDLDICDCICACGICGLMNIWEGIRGPQVKGPYPVKHHIMIIIFLFIDQLSGRQTPVPLRWWNGSNTNTSAAPQSSLQ